MLYSWMYDHVFSIRTEKFVRLHRNVGGVRRSKSHEELVKYLKRYIFNSMQAFRLYVHFELFNAELQFI